MEYGSCDHCYEEAWLTEVVNHDPTTSCDFDLVCALCVEVQQAEHVGHTLERRKALHTWIRRNSLQDEQSTYQQAS